MTERFTLLIELGRGGMGVVWKARDEETGRIVALKLLREAYAEDPDYLARFERELELAKRIHSAHVVEVLGYGVRQKVPYLALEYVDGPSLHERLAGHGPYSWPEARALLAQLAEGLADAHEAGVIHRDLKPSNVLIDSDGVAKLADFGIAKGLDLTRMTGTSTMLGTPSYLPPEGPSDERSDLYSLGVIAYEMLSGVVPFEGRTYQEVILRHVRESADLEKLPKESRQLVGRLLAKNPSKRPQSARELAKTLAHSDGSLAQEAGFAARSGTRASKQRSSNVRRASDGSGAAVTTLGHHQAWRRAAPAAGLGILVVVLGATVLAGGFIASPTKASPTPGSSHTTGAVGSTTTLSQSPLESAPNPTPTPTPGFAITSSMTAARDGATATLLNDGKVLIAGGSGSDGYLASAELFDPASRTFGATGAMSAGREGHTATLLSDGKVLVAGGMGGQSQILGSADLYDPATGTFSPTGSLVIARWGHTATLLPDGRVLIAGGDDGHFYACVACASAELYDPKTGRFSEIRGMAYPRVGHTATVLKDGKVLVAGGAGILTQGPGGFLPRNMTAATELYDPTTGAFSLTGRMETTRWHRTASRLSDGEVLMTGGDQGFDGDGPIAGGELYDPVAGVFTSGISMTVARSGHTATLLRSGSVLVVGGKDRGDNFLASSELYDPVTKTFRSAGSMSAARSGATATQLNDGRVLIAGGFNGSVALASAELYQP